MFRVLTLCTLLLSNGLSHAAEPEAENIPVQSSQYYVSDDVGIIMRSGPTNGYRVIGNLPAGTAIQALESANDRTKVQTADGDTGWISTEYITDQPTIRAKYQQVLNKNNELKQQLNEVMQDIADKDNIIQLNNTLQQQVSELGNERDTLRQQNSLLKDRFHSDVFYAGALVLLFGMFLSWVLLRFGKKRRQSSGWR